MPHDAPTLSTELFRSRAHPALRPRTCYCGPLSRDAVFSACTQVRYIELYFYHTPGRCSLCRSKTTNDRSVALKVRMCSTCATQEMINKTSAKAAFCLSDQDFKK